MYLSLIISGLQIVCNLVWEEKKIRENCIFSRISVKFCGAGGNAKNCVTGSLLISICRLITLLTGRSPVGH